MTQEEKARAYDEALEKAKKTLESSSANEIAKTVIYHFFPELQESEDERIRQSILHKMKACQKMSNFFNEKEISYLEKQKEQKPAEVDESTKRLNDNWMKQHFDDYEEQKPAEWSEEDKTMINHIIEALPKWANGLITILPSQAEEYVKRLKSLRPSWKPSEEQMGALSWMLENARSNIDFDPLKDLYEHLKKL